MWELLAAAVFFTGFHLVVAGTPLRGRLVAVLGGETRYLALFSLVSIAGLAWLVVAWADAPYVALWGELTGLHRLAAALTLLAFLLAVIGLTTPNPTSVGTGGLLAREQAVRGVLRITRHPFLWGVALWAVAHLLVNGDLAALILFGSLLVLALAGTGSIDVKRGRAFGEEWRRFAEASSSVPFLAIARGRNRLALGEIGWWRPVLGLIAWWVVLYFHGPWFGAAPLVR